ncbi:MAG: hypothetical protein ACJ766_13335 [Thermoleophilaceae bacterium]
MNQRETVGDGPRYTSLRDYLRVLRENRLMVVILVVLFGAATAFLSASQEKTYSAEARLAFSDPTEDLDILGASANARPSAQFAAAAGAQTAVQPKVLTAVRRDLHMRASTNSLRNAISVQTEQKTQLVVVTADAHSPTLAARIANAFAREIKRFRTDQVRRHYAAAARSQRRRFNQEKLARQAPAIRADFESRLSRLESLRDIAQPVSIQEPARKGEKTGPHPVRDGLLGAFAGLVLGVIAAFVRDALDVRLRGPAQIQSTLGLPVLASVSRDALGSAGPTGGRKNRSWARDVEAFRMLRRNLDFLRRSGPIRSVAVTSALPEEGKSTIAASLAWAYATAGSRTLLIDCDFRRPCLAERLGVPPVPGLTDYLLGKAQVEEVLKGVPVELGVDLNGNSPHPKHEGELLTVIPAGSSTSAPTELLEKSLFNDFLAVVSRSYDRVVLDSSPLLPVADTLELLVGVDAAIVCIRNSQTTKDQATAMKSILAKFPTRPVGVVVTGAPTEEYPAYGYYQPPADVAETGGRSG